MKSLQETGRHEKKTNRSQPNDDMNTYHYDFIVYNALSRT